MSEKVAALCAENVGVIFFRNVFTACPALLQLFSFKNEENLYESKALKAHGKLVITTGLLNLTCFSKFLNELYHL